MSSAHDAPVLTVESTRQYRRQIEKAGAFLGNRISSVPVLGFVFDSNIEGLDGSLEVHDSWEAEEIPHFPVLEGTTQSTTIAVGRVADVPVIVLDGGLSLHEGYTPREVVFPVRVFAEIGVETLLFANAAGSVASEIRPPELVLLTDHINFQGVNPLVGPNVEDWGPRFPDMTAPYDASLRQVAETAALEEGINLHQGIYFAMLGPNRGTQAEYRMARTLGADVVGMTVVPEVIAARHMGVRVLGVSIITDRCVPGRDEVVSAGTAAEAIQSARPTLDAFLTSAAAPLTEESRS